VDDIILLLKQYGESYTNREKLDYLIFFANLCALSGTIRNMIVGKGVGDILVELGWTMLEEKSVL
jgi:hypothetical protein